MRDFLKYVESSTTDMATVSNGSLTRHIHDVVEKVKIERRVDYMTLQEMIDEEKREGYEEGLAEGERTGIEKGRAEGEKTGAEKEKQSIIKKMRASGMSEEQIAQILG